MHYIFNRLAKEVWTHSICFCVPLEKRAPKPLTQPPTKVKKMPTAFVLLNTEIGAENQVLNNLKKIEGVEEAHGLWGVYDIIVNIQAQTMDELKDIISKNIDKAGKITSKLTMLVSEQPAPVSFIPQRINEEKPVFEERIPIYA